MYKSPEAQVHYQKSKFYRNKALNSSSDKMKIYFENSKICEEVAQITEEAKILEKINLKRKTELIRVAKKFKNDLENYLS